MSLGQVMVDSREELLCTDLSLVVLRKFLNKRIDAFFLRTMGFVPSAELSVPSKEILTCCMPSIEYVNAVIGLELSDCFGHGNPNLIEPPLSPALKIAGMSEAKDKEMQNNIWNIANKRIALVACIIFGLMQDE